MLAALDAEAIPALPVRARPAPGLRRGRDAHAVSPAAAPFAVNLFYVNGDGMRGFFREHGTRLLEGRYSIGVWWWELQTAPARWMQPSRQLDEIWVCSEHVREAVAPVVDVPVRNVPQPVPLPLCGGETRAELGFPDGFIFYTAFDQASTAARKNPLGAVQAFQRAFPTPGDAHLVIRSYNVRRDSPTWRALERAASQRPDIRILDGYLADATKNAMLAHCDCYVSLHRAEGFGLPLAEAMRLGKPAIATGWSGNREFMTDENSYLVDYALTRVGDGAWPYPRDGVWAEPDVDDAARLMRQVLGDPEAAAGKGRQASIDLARGHDPANVGPDISAHLDAIRPALTRRAAARSPRRPGPLRRPLLRSREQALAKAVAAGRARQPRPGTSTTASGA